MYLQASESVFQYFCISSSCSWVCDCMLASGHVALWPLPVTTNQTICTCLPGGRASRSMGSRSNQVKLHHNAMCDGILVTYLPWLKMCPSLWDNWQKWSSSIKRDIPFCRLCARSISVQYFPTFFVYDPSIKSLQLHNFYVYELRTVNLKHLFFFKAWMGCSQFVCKIFPWVITTC